jgi:hypothetical protein
LNQDFLVIAKNEDPKSVPFRFKDPSISRWNFFHAFGKHRQDGRIDGKVHDLILNSQSKVASGNLESIFGVSKSGHGEAAFRAADRCLAVALPSVILSVPLQKLYCPL